jgi:carbonic anhydrase
MQGNQRFVNGIPEHPNQTVERRNELIEGQQPFAILLCCSDSRVPPEIIFDQGIGDLFVVRTAGNIADDVALGSIEYAAQLLGVQLIVVLGHQSCGAVTAAAVGGEAPGHIASLVEMIRPAVDLARDKPGELLTNAIRVNAKLVAGQLEGSAPILSELVKAGQLKVIAAQYDLDSGIVSLIP